MQTRDRNRVSNNEGRTEAAGVLTCEVARERSVSVDMDGAKGIGGGMYGVHHVRLWHWVAALKRQ